MLILRVESTCLDIFIAKKEKENPQVEEEHMWGASGG